MTGKLCYLCSVSLDVITGVPRYDGATLTGTVKIRRATALTGNNFVFYGNVTGSQVSKDRLLKTG